MELDLTEDDLEVAEASVRFAMENCPIEGLLSKEDGTSVSLDVLGALLDRVQESERTPGMKLGGDAVSTLRLVIDYTSENCPVEGVATYRDGRPISGRNIAALDERLRAAKADGPKQEPATP